MSQTELSCSVVLLQVFPPYLEALHKLISDEKVLLLLHQAISHSVQTASGPVLPTRTATAL